MKSIPNGIIQGRKLSWPWQHFVCLYRKLCRVLPVAAVKAAIGGSAIKQQ